MDVLAEPLTARAVLRCLMRDLRQQARNGVPVPAWAQPVLVELAALADVESADIGTNSGSVGTGDSRMHLVPVAEAAAAVGKSREYVRRLARTGRIRGQRAGTRMWLVDQESLKGVLGNADQDKAS